MYTICAQWLQRSEALGPLELKLQIAVSYHVGAGIWPQLLWKSSQCAWLLNHFFRPHLNCSCNLGMSKDFRNYMSEMIVKYSHLRGFLFWRLSYLVHLALKILETIRFVSNMVKPWVLLSVQLPACETVPSPECPFCMYYSSLGSCLGHQIQSPYSHCLCSNNPCFTEQWPQDEEQWRWQLR